MQRRYVCVFWMVFSFWASMSGLCVSIRVLPRRCAFVVFDLALVLHTQGRLSIVQTAFQASIYGLLFSISKSQWAMFIVLVLSYLVIGAGLQNCISKTEMHKLSIFAFCMVICCFLVSCQVWAFLFALFLVDVRFSHLTQRFLEYQMAPCYCHGGVSSIDLRFAVPISVCKSRLVVFRFLTS